MARNSIRLLLLDANVVIALHELGVWEQTVDRCEVLLPDAVAQEVKYYSTGERQARIELESAFHSGSMRAVSVTLERLEEFRRRFRPTFLERLDPGEAEALAYLTLEEPEASISSADKIVWRTLGVLGMGEQGISLEEILERIGLGRQVDRPFSKAYRLQWTKHGFEEGMQGEGIPF